ncbi:MAG: hypothetical protein GSR80_001778 [Desulfurococcales archaeon]|nr:hypothetical protein [Desulfurococcales archaeon]
MLVITVYGAFDYSTRMAVERARLAALILARHYGLECEVEEVDLPVGSDEAPLLGLPEVVVEYDERRRTVSSGSVPEVNTILDSVFDVLESVHGTPLALGALGLGDNEAEEGLLGV